MLEWIATPFFRDLPNPGIKFGSPALQANSLLSEPLVNPKTWCCVSDGFQIEQLENLIDLFLDILFFLI